MSEKKIPMGAPCKDVVTGFSGIVCGYAKHLTGCDTVGIRPTELDKDKKLPDSQWFDVTRIQITGKVSEEVQRVVDGKLQLKEKGKPKVRKGGPQDTPQMDRG